ncbi:glycoside hydrolase family 9 protein [Colwellia sp. RSH04]|uniref:glycoside hydrolase family 9 protein n=1 Tax=Colwellia sp. RSH04 TaxID=2305464 RepID=UPI0015FA81F8|nr:glycoside hydrolase family 9 protein [Colwellia sp. RSH04]
MKLPTQYVKGIIAAMLLMLTACTTTESTTHEKSKSLNIHVNQVAYELTGPKQAIVSTNYKVDLTRANVQLISDKDIAILQGKLVELGQVAQWQKAHKSSDPIFYYGVEFTELQSAGSYVVKLSDQHTQQTSAKFTVGKQALFKLTAKALLTYFNGSRNDEQYNWQEDQHIRIFDTQRYVDVRGGWNDAGGDTGKYLSHLSYANYMNPQQLAHVGWALAYSYQRAPHLFKELALEKQVIEEVFWGADYLHRTLDEQGYFYMTVFDQWNTNNAERVVTAYVGADGIYSENYQSAFRQGAGSAIAALARAAMLAKTTAQQGEYSGDVYLADAEKAFKHLQSNNAENNKAYADDGEENIIDDYTALLAATELYKATQSKYYLNAARERANNLAQRLSPEGWFISNNINSENLRPFYHAAEAGFPILALSQYIAIEDNPEKVKQSQAVMQKHMAYQLAINNQVSNPFNYARQTFKTYEQGKLSTQLQTGFFIPHANETEYWWQGESARLSSLAMAAILTGKMNAVNGKKHLVTQLELAKFAQNQMDWTLGRNPYDLSMLNGFGVNNPIPYDGLSMVYGGISNGITGAKTSPSGQGIEFGPEKDWQNWRWVEQWLPHSTWFLLAATEMAVAK